MPASKNRKQNQPLHGLLLTTEDRADLDTARMVLHRFELRWRIERFFRAPTVGNRIEDRRPDETEDLCKSLVFDAITAFRVRKPSILARERRDDPASRPVNEDDTQAFCALASHHGFKFPRAPAGDDHRGLRLADRRPGGLPSLEARAATRNAVAPGGREVAVSGRHRHPDQAGMEQDSAEGKGIGFME